MSYDPTKDHFAAHGASPKTPARVAQAITPNDSTDLTTYAKALYVGVAGDLRVLPVANADDAAVTLKNHPIGYAPIQVRRVLATGTTATDIVGLVD